MSEIAASVSNPETVSCGTRMKAATAAKETKAARAMSISESQDVFLPVGVYSWLVRAYYSDVRLSVNCSSRDYEAF